MEPQQPQKVIAFDPSRFFESFGKVCRDLVVRPRKFFRQLRPTGRIKNPFIFLVICSFGASLIIANLTGGDFRVLFALLFTFAGSVCLSSFLFYNVVLKIIGLSVPFEAVFSIMAYASLSDIFIPIFGIFAVGYGCYLMYLGIQEVLRLPPGRALTAVFFLAVLMIVLRSYLILLTAESWVAGLQQLIEAQNAARLSP